MLVRELVTKLGFKTDEGKVKSFDSSVKSATATVAALAAAVTAATTAIFFLVRSAAKTGDELDKTKDVLGLTVEQIQLLSGAAALSGVEHDKFTVSMQFFAKAVGMARMGMMQQLQAFQMLGISLRGANGQVKNQYDLFLEVTKAMANLRNGQDRLAVSQILFSRGGAKMVNMFKGGVSGLKDMMAKVKEYGFIMDEKATKKSAEFTDQMYLARLVIKSFKEQIGLKLMPVFSEMLKQFLEWVKINKQIIVQDITKLFKGIIIVTKGVAKVFGFLISTITNIVAILKTFNNEFRIALHLFEVFVTFRVIEKIHLLAHAFEMLDAAIAFLETPIVLLTAAFAALFLIFDDINAYMQGKDSLIGRFVHDFPRAAKAIGIVLRPIKSFLEDYIIKPLEWIMHLIDMIENKFNKIMPVLATQIAAGGIPIGEGGAVTKGMFGLPSLQLGGLTPAMASPSANANNININTNVNLGVPSGTSTEQKSFLISSAKDAFHSNFSNEIKKALTVFPGVEK